MSGGGRFGPYHHRDGLPPQGNLYDAHGHRIPPEKTPDPNDDGVDYGRVYQGPVKPKKPKKPKRPKHHGSGGSGGKTSKRQRQGRRGKKGVMRSSGRRSGFAGSGSGVGRVGVVYPASAQATGGAIAAHDLSALAGVGMTAVLAEIVGRGSGGAIGGAIGIGRVLSLHQREQDRITNRTWRRPGGLARPAGL